MKGICTACGLLIIFGMTGAIFAAGPGQQEYLAGLDALSSGDWSEAAAAFAKAAGQDDENPAYHQARGVALTLGEQFPQAIAEYKRANRLRDDPETTLWLAATLMMSGDTTGASSIFSFTLRNHEYVDFIYNQMAADYWSSKTHGTIFDRVENKQVQVPGPVKTGFPKAAGYFIQAHQAAGAAGGAASYRRMVELYNKGDHAGALRLIRLLSPGRIPDDLKLLGYLAHCSLAVGDVTLARTLYTRLATAEPENVNWYLGRALAQASLGDQKRSDADLRIAEQLKSPQVAAYQRDAAKRLAGFSPLPPGVDYAELEKSVRDNDTPQRQLQIALHLQRSTNVKRLRLDETHQEKIRTLTAAINAKPTDPDRLAAMATYLWEASSIRGEKTSFRAPILAYRWVAADELDRARALGERALSIQPRHGDALAVVAHLQLYNLEYGDAERTINRLSAAAPNHRELPMLYAQLMHSLAALRASKAAGLRRIEQWSDDRYLYTRRPSQADLDKADELDAQARRLRAQGEGALEAAIQRFAGGALGDYCQASLQRGRGQTEAALASLLRMVGKEPDSVLGWSQLAGTYAELGRASDSAAARSRAVNLVQTTITPLLESVEPLISQTRWTSANAALQQAATIDPANPRLSAFRAVIAAAQQRADEAMIFHKMTLLIDEARSRLEGTTLGEAGPMFYNPDQFGLTTTVRLQLARMLTAQGRSDQAVELCRINVAYEKRITDDQRTALLYSGMLPDPSLDPTELPAADSVATALAWSHLRLGDALAERKQFDAAAAEYKTVRAYEADWPSTMPGRETVAEPASWARLGEVKLLAAQGKLQEAKTLIMAGWRGKKGSPLDIEARRLQDQIFARINQQLEQELETERNMSPAQMQLRRMQEDIRQLKEQRASYEKELADPNLPPRDKQAMRMSIQQLDQFIQQREAALQRFNSQPDQPATPQPQRPARTRRTIPPMNK